MRESSFDKIVGGLTVVYVLGRGLIAQRWEFVTLIVWAVCLIVAWHALKAAVAVSAEISQEIAHASGEKETSILSPLGGHATISVTPVKPRLYRLQLFGAATIIWAFCGSASYSVWHIRKEPRVYPWVSANVSVTKDGGSVVAVRLPVYVREWPPDANDEQGKFTTASLFHLNVTVDQIASVGATQDGNETRKSWTVRKLTAPEWSNTDARAERIPWLFLHGDVTVLLFRAEARQAFWDGYIVVTRKPIGLAREEAIVGMVTLPSGAKESMALTTWTEDTGDPSHPVKVSSVREYHPMTKERLIGYGTPIAPNMAPAPEVHF